ncbi:MAG: CRTAC1 family protein, partial [Planctomycetaceae bacterium]|nr:CRTAC1 family protein [Planctomycetaceae bacterium]
MRSRPFVMAALCCFCLSTTATLGQEPDEAGSPEKEGNTPAESTPLTPEQQAKLDALKDALKKNNPEQHVKLLREAWDAGIPFEQLPFNKVFSNLYGPTGLGPHDRLPRFTDEWETILPMTIGKEYEMHARAWIFRCAMEGGDRERAMKQWEHVKQRQTEKPDEMLWVYCVGFVRSKLDEDKKFGVELANKAYLAAFERTREEYESIRVPDPVAMQRMRDILVDHEKVALAYCLIYTGNESNPALNPFLKDQPDSTIHFRRVKDAGFPDAKEGERVSLADVDGDGFTDVLVCDSGLYKNLGGTGKFERVDERLGADTDGKCCIIADLDNNGRPDIVVAGREKQKQAAKDRLVVSMQQNDGKFKVIENPSPVTAKVPRAIGVFDGDMDGFVDLYIASYEGNYHEAMGEGTTDVILRNKSDGTFEDVAEAWGFTTDKLDYCGDGVTSADFNNDGLTDIYVSNYRLQRNQLWRNASKDGETRFVQCAANPWFSGSEPPKIGKDDDLGVQGRMALHLDDDGVEHQLYGHTHGSAWGDVDNNGWLDLVCANLAHPRYAKIGFSDLSRLYLNTGTVFVDNTFKAQIAYTERPCDPLLADFNNDGHLDLSIGNNQRLFSNHMHVGNGDGSFTEVTWKSGVNFTNTCGHAAFDFDNDGDLDIIAMDQNEGVKLFENLLNMKDKVAPGGNFIELQLMGAKGVNTMAYGARVTVKAGDRTYTREVFGGRGDGNCDDPVVHVGLGSFEDAV